MVASRSMIAMLVGALGIACAGSGVSASYATVRSGADRREVRPADLSADLAARPWWSAFQSETLDALIAQVRRDGAPGIGGTHLNKADNLDGPAAEIGVSAAYVALLVQTLSLTYIDNARAAAQRQSQLMAAGPALHDDFSRELARREATARASIKRIDAMREAQLADLALRAGMPTETLQKTIADEVAARKLPHFAASLPQALPAVLLANRDDIQLAASLYGIEPRTLLAGTIRAAGQEGANGDAEDGGDAEPDADLPGYPLFPQAVAQGRAEVADALRRLQARSGLAAAAEQRAREAKATFEMSKARLDRGESSEVQMLEDFQGLMLDQQRLAAARGDLAIAWIALMASLGSRTSVVLRASPARDAAALRERPGLIGSF